MEITVISRKEAINNGLSRYFTSKLCKRGHLSERRVSSRGCLMCISDREINKKEEITRKRLEYNEANKEAIKNKKREYYIKNKGAIKEYLAKNKEKISKNHAEYRMKNKEYFVKYKSEYRNKNKSLAAKYKRDNKDKIAKWTATYRRKNPAMFFAKNSLYRVISDWKGGRYEAEKAIGYTYDELVSRIEFNFKDGMTWSNHGEWHIDHKKPISRFIKQGVTDPRIINALSNLQPLWAKDNLKKGDKF